jgi:hypothetical protein
MQNASHNIIQAIINCSQEDIESVHLFWHHVDTCECLSFYTNSDIGSVQWQKQLD